jgi:hypothetical protein
MVKQQMPLHMQDVNMTLSTNLPHLEVPNIHSFHKGFEALTRVH